MFGFIFHGGAFQNQRLGHNVNIEVMCVLCAVLLFGKSVNHFSHFSLFVCMFPFRINGKIIVMPNAYMTKWNHTKCDDHFLSSLFIWIWCFNIWPRWAVRHPTETEPFNKISVDQTKTPYILFSLDVSEKSAEECKKNNGIPSHHSISVAVLLHSMWFMSSVAMEQ